MEKKIEHKLASIEEISEIQLKTLDSGISYDAIILNTNFNIEDVGIASVLNKDDNNIKDTISLIEECCSKLKDGGLLFLYGLPNYLAILGEHLSDNNRDEFSYLFKYWIACEFQAKRLETSLPTAHVGLLMYLKTKKKLLPTPFELNTKYVRVPYADCPACKKTTKDWGGKKHLINPLGSALSDVWDFNELPIDAVKNIPNKIVDRILALLSDNRRVLKVIQTEAKINLLPQNDYHTKKENKISKIEHNQVVHESCIKYLNDIYQQYPEGVFDLAFADPPYNLAKNYSKYQDDLEEKKYINWCNEWLLGMYNTLKPGGSLLVLNIPKWSIYHFNFLADKMIFRNWIVWDALSTPAGKFLPAHYSLLYFTKPGNANKINIEENQYIDSRIYCLRNSCLNKRKKLKEDKKELLNDIWKDVHRIKHKKDRDQHPCQLPTKLMERIIKTFSNEGDLIFDPFGGAGTTAIAAKLLNRNYVITELDEKYVSIAEKNLSKIQPNIYGSLSYERESVAKPKSAATPRKQFEKSYMSICIEADKIFSIQDLQNAFPDVYDMAANYSGDFVKLQAATKRKIEATLFITTKTA